MGLISMIAVLALTVWVCVFSLNFITEVCGEMEKVHGEAMECAREGELKRANEELQRMVCLWKEREDVLSVLVTHESIHEITGLLIQAQACLRAEDMDDFFESMAHLEEALGHMQEDERLHLSNIL